MKGKFRLDRLSCKTSKMISKEIEIAMLTYNLVRALTCQVARQEGIDPRRFSFTRVKNIVNIYRHKIAAAKSGRELEEFEKKLYDCIRLAILPKRKKKRKTYPRAVWHSAKPFPRQKAQK